MFVAISQSIYPSSFTVTDSVNFMLNCFLGGLGFVFGPMLGTLVLYFGWDLLFQTGRFQLLIYSSLLIALMLVLPNGILSLALRQEGGGGRDERDPRGEERHQALRRADREQRRLLRCRRARDPVGDRAERRRQIHALQADRLLPAGRPPARSASRASGSRASRRTWWRGRAWCAPSRRPRSSAR